MHDPRSPQLNSSNLPRALHACAFFRSDEEEYQSLVPIAQHAAVNCATCAHFLDSERKAERGGRLAEAGVSTAGTAGGGAEFDLRSWEETYLDSGGFVQARMLKLVDELLREARGSGSGVAHVWANMEWTLSGLPGCSDFVEYESRVNALIEEHGGFVFCVYRLPLYSAQQVIDILRTHPYLLVDGELVQNALYVSTDTFLSDLKRRSDIGLGTDSY
jgi:hypothetical protein